MRRRFILVHIAVTTALFFVCAYFFGEALGLLAFWRVLGFQKTPVASAWYRVDLVNVSHEDLYFSALLLNDFTVGSNTIRSRLTDDMIGRARFKTGHISVAGSEDVEFPQQVSRASAVILISVSTKPNPYPDDHIIQRTSTYVISWQYLNSKPYKTGRIIITEEDLVPLTSLKDPAAEIKLKVNSAID